jgi:hypothetical protein
MKVSALIVAGVTGAGLIVPAVSAQPAFASCVIFHNAVVGDPPSISSTVVKQNNSCQDLNERNAAVADLARGQYLDHGTWVASAVGDKTLSTSSTLKVFVSNVLSGVKLRIHDKEFPGASTEADLVF